MQRCSVHMSTHAHVNARCTLSSSLFHTDTSHRANWCCRRKSQTNNGILLHFIQTMYVYISADTADKPNANMNTKFVLQTKTNLKFFNLLQNTWKYRTSFSEGWNRPNYVRVLPHFPLRLNIDGNLQSEWCLFSRRTAQYYTEREKKRRSLALCCIRRSSLFVG